MRIVGLVLAATVAATIAPTRAVAHPGVDDRIHRLDHELAHHPNDPRLYLRRGELYAEDGRYEKAQRDFDRAARLAPELSVVHYYRGVMRLEAEDFAEAESELSAFIETSPQHVKAHRARARARVRLGKILEAHDDYTVAIRESEEPSVQLYFERAQALLSLGDEHLEEALHGLAEGSDRLDAPVVLVELALQAEVARGRPEAALQWLDELPAELARSPHWLARRGDLLVAAGHPWEALMVYVVALSHLTQLPESRRTAPAMAVLASRLRGEIVKVGASQGLRWPPWPLP